MLAQLGRIIEKRPRLVVTVIILITIGFSLFIPSLKFKTDFADFAPDSEQVKASNRIANYFGMSRQTMILYVQKENAENTITPHALRDQYELQQELAQLPEINSSVSFTTFVDIVCQMEFNRTLSNCTDEQLSVATHDLLTVFPSEEIKIFSTDDPDEPYDYYQSARRSKGQNVESADIKNCYIYKDNKTLSFSFEVYSLSDYPSPVKPPLPRVNVMEWYLGFENSLLPPEFDIHYQIAARIEPTTSYWEIGNGFLSNLQHLLQTIRNRQLSTYRTTAYLWMKPPGQETFFPMQLQTGNVTVDKPTNRITIIVSRQELSNYGIAPQFGSFEIPAKLTNFTAGVRYYQTPLFHRPGGHLVINTTYLFHRIERLYNRPIIGALVSRILQKYDIDLDDFSNLSGSIQGIDVLPSIFSFIDLESLWIHSDTVPDTGMSTAIFPLIPQLFNDLRVNALSFLSKDYTETASPKASIIILQLNLNSSDSVEVAKVNNNIVNKIATFDTQFTSISVQATGEGIITTQINDVTMQANTIIGPAIFIIIVCILFIAFRKPSYVFLPIIVFAFSCIWLFGTMALLGISFSIITVALLPLNIGLGVEYSVNILYNYRAEMKKGRTSGEAIRLSIKEVGIAIFLAWFTTFVAFLSFLTATLPPIRDFGIFLALGITYTFIISMTFLMALRYLIDKRKSTIKGTTKTPRFSMAHFMGRLAQVLLRHQKKVFLVTILVCLVMGTAVTQLKSGFSMNQFIPQDNPAIRLFSNISENFPFSSQDEEYILIEGDVATVQSLQGIAETQEQMRDDQYIARKTDGSLKTESIYTIIQQAVANNQTLLTTFHIDETTDLPATDEDVYHLYDYLYESVEYGIQVQGVLYKQGDDFTATIIGVYIDFGTVSTDMTSQFDILSKELNDDIAPAGDTKSIVTGNTLITLSILKNMTESQILSTGVCFLLAAIMLSLIYRNPLLGLIAMIPVSISIIWVLGTMYFIGYTLNILTITVTCITVGVGIDYACYITERFRLTADKTGDAVKAVTETISRTGSAILIAALSSMFGFGVLVFAPIPPQQQFGIITAITLIYAFITSILVLPLVLARWATWRKKRKGYMIHPGAPKGLEGISEDTEYTGEQ
jgi:hydrophobe/amphiphile efflux-3 (HAE3) family protein